MSARPGGVTAVGVFYIIYSVFCLSTLSSIEIVTSSTDSFGIIMFIIGIAIGLVTFLDGIVLMQMKNWARILGIVLAFYLLVSAGGAVVLVLINPIGGFLGGMGMIILLCEVGFLAFVAIFALIVLFNETNAELFELFE